MHGDEIGFDLHPAGGESGVYMFHRGQEVGDFGFELLNAFAAAGRGADEPFDRRIFFLQAAPVDVQVVLV